MKDEAYDKKHNECMDACEKAKRLDPKYCPPLSGDCSCNDICIQIGTK